MGEARRDHDWGQTASILALTANLHRDPKKQKALSPSEFMPKREAGPTSDKKRDFDKQMIKAAFLRERERVLKRQARERKRKEASEQCETEH